MDRRELGVIDVNHTEKAEPEPAKELTELERKSLFEQLILPEDQMIRNLVTYYTDHYQNIDENYNTILFDLYRYIHTYDKTKPIKTWIHTVVRNNVGSINRQRYRLTCRIADSEFNPVEKINRADNCLDLEHGLLSLMDSISDEVRLALLSLPPLQLSAFVLQIQGYSINEITKIEFERGHLSKDSNDIIKNRIFCAKKVLRESLAHYGITRKRRKG